MRHFCRLCGSRADGTERRLGTYCPGNRCGADLVSGHREGVQAWCEPERRRAEPGATATVKLVVRNAGTRPDTFRVEPVERVYGNLDFDASVLNVPLAPKQTRVVEVRYTPPDRHTRLGIDVASRFGVPGADAAGRVDDGRSRRFGVALRVISTTANQGAAGAAFAVDVPRGQAPASGAWGLVSAGRGGPAAAGGARRQRSLLLAVGGVLVALVVVTAAVVVFAADGDDSAAPTAVSAAPVRPVQDPSGDATPGPGQDEPPGTPEESTPTRGGRLPGADPSVTMQGAATTVVPNTEMLDAEAAERALRAQNLVPRRVVQENSRGPKGQVIESSPAAGETVRAGSTVTITIRDGATTVPDVIGTDQASAQTKIRAAGLTTTVKSRVTTNEDEYGVVVAAYPPAGTYLPITTTITVYVGKPDSR